jgi:hypothetical protein
MTMFLRMLPDPGAQPPSCASDWNSTPAMIGLYEQACGWATE